MANCSSCAQRAAGATVVKFKVVDQNGKQIGNDYVTRVDAAREQLKSPGSRVVPITAAQDAAKPGPATNSQAKAKAQ